jgi:phytoene desaturase
VSEIVVVGGGIGGLAASALLARAGHETTLLEANGWLGGKSRRIEVGGQRIDTGPSLFTFPGVWKEFLKRYDTLGRDGHASRTSNLELRRMPEVGRYFFRKDAISLPVEEGHPWREAWEKFERIHGYFGPEVTKLLTSDPASPATLPALAKLLRAYGTRLTTRSYLDGLSWMPDGLREIVAIHTLNAGVSPDRTPALYASMPAVMARDGVFVPDGGVYEIVLALERLARKAGVEIRTSCPVETIEKGRVFSANGEHRADFIVGDLDANRLERLVEPEKKPRNGRLSCSGVAIYASLEHGGGLDLPPHSVVLPSAPDSLHASLEAGSEPSETMAFVNYYPPGEIYPNDKPTLAFLLTAPANGKAYDLSDRFVEREISRVSEMVGLSKPATEYFGGDVVFHPKYFERGGGTGGALYGHARPFWRSGPFHRPRYSDTSRPWLWRVGASVHPGGGIPAVLGGAIVSTGRLLRKLNGNGRGR